ncbi:MAG: DUF1592 domain-containing protein [Proteobacteria bacterium]|nr:DUF1592 domain-containing protein [Pseudomonadota bacterium]
MIIRSSLTTSFSPAMRKHLSLLTAALLALCPAAGAAAGAHTDFLKQAAPFLDKHCRECHGGKSTKADLNLVKLDRADEAILKNRKVWLNVLQQVSAGEMPPPKLPRPTLAEIEQFTHAIESAFERAEATMKPDPGRVTARRLNRTEYHNTVRDLLFVDFNPTENFPADDIGHGFDNIADVLTLSPLLMERYLDAAETIAQRVLVEKPAKPGVRYLSGRYLQPNNAQTPQDRFRLLDPVAPEAVKSGPFAAGGDYLKLTGDADLFLRATVYAEPRGTAPVKVVLFLQGAKLTETSTDAEIAQLAGAGVTAMKPLKILKTYEITARTAAKPQTIEFALHHVDGITRAGIAVLKPDGGEEPAKLFIENIWSEGPLETRPTSQLKLLAGLEGKPQAQQTREVLTSLLTRAYRRPATAKEIATHTQLVEETVAGGRAWEAGLQRAIAAILCSPKFLFRIELDDRPDAKQPHPLEEFQLASRLSYFLWSTMPDAELFALAEKRQLTAQLGAQVQRMLKDPKAAALVDNFAMQWLQLKRLQTFAPDTKLFPAFNDNLRRAMLRETELFFGEIIREDRSVLDLIDADYTYLNDTLARHYGITDTLGNRPGTTAKSKRPGGKPFARDTFTRINLSANERGGLLSQASILTVTSNPTRTSPVKRGRWVLQQLLGTPPPPPPPNVPELDSQKKLTGSLRQRMEQHRTNPACASCHAQMDALGFALENYDAIGGWRTKDGEDAIDASGKLPDGRAFNGPGELKALLKDKKDLFTRNLTEQLLTYALGRGLEYYDSRALRQITTTTAKQDYKFSALVTAIVQSDPFSLRRGKDLAEAGR